MPNSASPDPADEAPVQMHWGVKIPMRDGLELNATLYLPRSVAKPSPALFTLTPYIGQRYHETGEYFARHGYPFLTVDVRGRGNSEGTFAPFRNEAKDGHDIVEWLAGQSYCDGQVAMWGGSYGGFDQWTTATQFASHLVTIVPAASPYVGVDFPRRNNVSLPYAIQWLTLVSGRAVQENIFADQRAWSEKFKNWFESGESFRKLDTQVGNPSTVFQDWQDHPLDDSWWEAYNPTADQYSRLMIPVLTITGMYDGDQLGALTHYRQHLKYASAEASSRHYLVIGPWDHAGTRTPRAEFGGMKFGSASLVDLSRLHLQWYAWHMQGGSKPEFLQKNVAYYVTAADKWRYADSLEAITSYHSTFYLQSRGNPTDVFNSGALGADLPETNGPDHYIYDPRDMSHIALEGLIDPESLVDQRTVHLLTGRQLVYHTAAFPQDIEVSGFFKLNAWIAIDQPDTDFIVSIYEIDLQGSSVLLTCDWFRARFRESLREERLIQTLEPLSYNFESFPFVSRCIRAGHRLRLVIGPGNTIHLQRNFNTGGVVADETLDRARTVTVKLFHDKSHPSALYVPVGRPGA